MHMKRSNATLAFAFLALLLLGNFTCGEFCEKYFLLHEWESTWLDNSGNQPRPTADMAPRAAFGIRLSAFMSLDGVDTLNTSEADDACYLFATQPLAKIQVFATDGFDTLAAGQDISDRFRVRRLDNTSLRYVPLQTAETEFNSIYPPFDERFQLDLLMMDPPSQPGEYRFSVQIQFDSLAGPVMNRDTFFTLPTITLQ